MSSISSPVTEQIDCSDFRDDFDDDDFGDFDDFETSIETEASVYSDVLYNHSVELMHSYFNEYLNRLWSSDHKDTLTDTVMNNETDILNTSCSRKLWNELSCHSLFYNPITGASGQFQWTRSETNKSYLNALGVTIQHGKSQHRVAKKKKDTVIKESSPILKVVTTPNIDESSKETKKEAEQELELDIDIARAYCELTEETIRVFPNVKLNAMVTELTRLHKQAEDCLDQLLDQKEQLKIDSETYNDLISCIVGHAQRLHVNSKDASPAMVTKTKKHNDLFAKRKLSLTKQQSVSMGGGVVGLKKKPSLAVPETTTEK